MAPASILVVDDDPAIRELMEMSLEDDGYQVRTAANGHEALRETALSPIQLILLDMRMAGMDGWTFAREYKRREGRTAPIVVVTAAENAASRAAEIGADGYLAKPFSLDELQAVVRRYVRLDAA